MKAVTIRQPFAWLVVMGHKDIENRSWATSHRGPLIIHAGKAKPSEALIASLESQTGINIPRDLPRGGIVGRVELADCVTRHRSRWFNPRPGNFGWVLTKARRLPFRAMAGKLKLFDV